MVLGKLPVPGRATIWMIGGQGPSVRVGVVCTFLLLSIFSILFLPLSGRRPDIDLVVVLLFYVCGKHLRSFRDGQLT